jgi:26S proteasome non-ATPase regulatory subunit 9
MEEFQRLSEEKTRIEAEIEVIVEELTSGENAPGLKGPLVDQEGFPRADIDVYRVRHQRHLFATLQTDHQQIMKQIEQILPQYVHGF